MARRVRAEGEEPTEVHTVAGEYYDTVKVGRRTFTSGDAVKVTGLPGTSVFKYRRLPLRNKPEYIAVIHRGIYRFCEPSRIK